MRDVLKTNNAVALSYAESLLAEAGIAAFVFDTHVSIVEGSLGILPRRLMVAEDDAARAEKILEEGFALVESSETVPTSEDRFLDGKIVVRQPVAGFRAGLDAVMLSAAVPAKDGDAILELGSGAGTASLCLARRVDASVVGVEIDPDLTLIANGNADANGLEERAVFVTADVLDLPPDMKRDYAHVFCNPPFHSASGEASPEPGRALALEDAGKLGEWLVVGVRRTAPGGTFTIIIRADRMGEALSVLPQAGIRILPLWPRRGQVAKRVIIQVTKGSRAALAMLPGLELHANGASYTPEADAILRGEATLAQHFRGL